MVVCLVGLGGEAAFAQELVEAVKSVYGVEARIVEEIPLDKASFSESRKQYDAEKLLNYLTGCALSDWEKYEDCSKLLGIVSKDMFVQGMNFVFGLAVLNGKTGLVSIARLDPRFYGKKEDEKKIGERAVKEVLHELGHLLGLSHCENKECVMSFSNSINEVDEKKPELCPECRGKLSAV
jgi:archaemetzincin